MHHIGENHQTGPQPTHYAKCADCLAVIRATEWLPLAAVWLLHQARVTDVQLTSWDARQRAVAMVPPLRLQATDREVYQFLAGPRSAMDEGLMDLVAEVLAKGSLTTSE